MPQDDAIEAIMGLIEDQRVLELDQAAVRIPSHSYQEHALADFYANRLADLGLEVEMMDVRHPTDEAKTTRQPVGRLRGTGGGPTLMLNGHMDTIEIVSGWTVDPYGGTFKDGWIWGAGAHDDKGGLAAAICAVEAILRSGTQLKGDVLVCPVACHKGGGVGTRTLLKNGIRPDMCINMEHSANTIATSCVGRVQIRITTRNRGLFFRSSAEAKAAYFNAIEQQAAIIQRLGPSIEPATPGGWLTFTPDPDLPGFPMHLFSAVQKDRYPRECELTLDVRTVPGQTVAHIEADLTGLLEEMKAENPNLDYEIAIPAGGPEDVTCEAPMWIAKDHPLVRALADGHRRTTQSEPVLGGGLRVGNVGDGNILCEAGIPSLQYGPGDIRLYPEWPGPDERVELREVVEASRSIAYAICRICG